MFEFSGAPVFNTIDYFSIILFFSTVFLPISFLSKNRYFQNTIHIILGMACIFSVAPRLLLVYIVFWIIVYIFIEISRVGSNGVLGAAKILIPSLVLLTPLVIWKLDSLDFERWLNIDVHTFIWGQWRAVGEIDAVYYLVAPLGLSFSVFRAIDLIVGVNLGTIEKVNFLDVLAYGLFAPVQIVGPIIQYKERERVAGTLAERYALARWGALQVFLGMGKAFILAWPIAWSASIFGVYATQETWVIWLAMAIYPIYLYLNFAGFSDISIGFAALYGYKLDPNFNHPLIRSSLQQFWNNWHMSLTRFAQRNIFVPLGGYRKKTQFFALFCTMMTIALWHDLSIALAIFGFLHGGALIVGRMYSEGKPGGSQSGARKISKRAAAPKPATQALGWAGTYAFLTLTFPLLVLHDGDIGSFYASLFGVR